MLKKLLPLTVLVVIALAGLGFLIVHPEGLFNRHSDLLAENLATQTILHKTWQSSHRWPLWRSDLLSGGPALTNPQALYTHPVHLLFALFAPERIVGLVIWLQMLLGALGAYYAASVLRLSVPGRLMVAVAMLFSFKTIVAVYAGWLTVLAGIAAMPMLFATVALTIQRPTWRSGLFAGLAGAWALYSGHPQLTYYAGLLLAVWAGTRAARLVTAREFQAAWRLVISLTLAAAVAVGLAAYLLLPLVFDIGLTTRTAATYYFFVGGAPLPARGLLTLFNPEFFATPLVDSSFELWEYVAYFGAVPSLLVLVAVVQCRQRPMVRLLTAGLLLTMLFSVDSPLLRFLYTYVPAYGLFRLPARMLFISTFLAFCLAGFGLDRVLATARTRTSRLLTAAFLIGLVAVEGTVWARRYLSTPDPMPFALGDDYVSALTRPAEPHRVGSLSSFLPAYGSAASLGVELVGGYDPFNLRHYQAYLDVLQYGRWLGNRPGVWTDLDQVTRFDLLAALNVNVITSSKPLDLPPAEYALEHTFQDQRQFRFLEGVVSGPVYVYRNQRFLSRAFFVDNVRSVTGDEEMLQTVEAANVRTTAIAEGAEAGVSPADADDHVSILHAEGGQLDLATRNRSRRFLVVSEIWHPGWSARVDGQPATLHRTDIALQGLWLEPGDHRVELRFWPSGLTTGLATTGTTIFGVLASLAVIARRARRRKART